jgi:Tol biopolymer transport system component
MRVRLGIAACLLVLLLMLALVAALLHGRSEEAGSERARTDERPAPENGELLFARGRFEGRAGPNWRIYGMDTSTRSVHAFSGVRFDEPYAGISPNSLQAVGTKGGDLWLVRRGSDKPAKISYFPQWEGNPRWSPDGRRLLYNENGRETSVVHVVQANGDANTILRLATGSAFTDASWTSSGSVVGVVGGLLGNPGLAYEVDVDTGEVARLGWTGEDTRRVVPSDRGDLALYRPSETKPGEEELWVGRQDGRGRMKRIASIGPPGYFAHSTWSPDGRRLAVSLYFSDDTGWRVLVLSRTEDVELGPTSGLPGRGPLWSPDAKRVAFMDAWGDLRLMDAHGEHSVRLTETPKAEYPIAWLAARGLG